MHVMYMMHMYELSHQRMFEMVPEIRNDIRATLLPKMTYKSKNKI